MSRPLKKTPLPESQNKPSMERDGRFAAEAAVRIRGVQDCLFSLLPEDHLIRLTKEWFKACAEATLRCNYSLIDQWVRNQSAKAAEEGFALQDLLSVLRVCRRCAIEVEGWNEDALSPVDDVIDEALSGLRGSVGWPITAGINYLDRNEEKSAPVVTATQILDKDISSGEKRKAGRCQLRIPIHIRSKDAQVQGREITKTASVSRTGLSFITAKNYDIGAELLIVYPYWATAGSINKEYLVRVVRMEPLPGGEMRVAVRFLESLGHKSDASMRETYQKTGK